jgi:serine/threonine protein kinase
VLSPLKYLHEHSICHRDITTTNILISSTGKVKIIDFNISRKLKEDDEDEMLS